MAGGHSIEDGWVEVRLCRISFRNFVLARLKLPITEIVHPAGKIIIASWERDSPPRSAKRTK